MKCSGGRLRRYSWAASSYAISMRPRGLVEGMIILPGRANGPAEVYRSGIVRGRRSPSAKLLAAVSFEISRKLLLQPENRPTTVSQISPPEGGDLDDLP